MAKTRRTSQRDEALSRIRDVIGDAPEWGSYEGCEDFEAKANQAAAALLRLVMEQRREGAAVALRGAGRKGGRR